VWSLGTVGQPGVISLLGADFRFRKGWNRQIVIEVGIGGPCFVWSGRLILARIPLLNINVPVDDNVCTSVDGTSEICPVWRCMSGPGA
jgi:hypothetical protein